jgi:2-polyprenyl-3-methyl-5-hydroxy-6-metoxy-1,4-benzoquinol methylase
MITRLFGKLKSSPLAKKYLEPLVANLLEENFSFNKTVIGTFVDSSGRKHDLYAGLRDRIKPGWRTMFDPKSTNRIPSKAELKLNLAEAERNIRSFKRTLQSFNYDLKDKSVLEVGCHNGLKTFLLCKEECANVTGSDVSFYYEKQLEADGKKEVDNYLDTLRQTVTNLFNGKEKQAIEKKVKFIEDDITKSNIKENSFDVIASWETLEHVIDIDSALNNMSKILKKNGIAFHEYNPFFSLNGGHSLCTLDFPWGHCRLNENDFKRYLKEFRPNEIQLAESFYKNSLNRLTMKDLEKACKNAGLEVLTLIPFVKKAHLSIFNNQFFEEAKEHFINLTSMDLISPVVWVMLKKK